MEGRLEQYAIDQSFACRVGKGTFHALRYAQKLASQGGYFLKLDIARFFASVDHGVLKGRLECLPCASQRGIAVVGVSGVAFFGAAARQDKVWDLEKNSEVSRRRRRR